MNLKQTRNKSKLDQFVKEHEKDPKGDKDRFGQALDSISHPERSKSTQETSSQDSSES